MNNIPSTNVSQDFVVFFVFSLFGGGAERVVSRLASEWVKNGTRVAIITETRIETDQYPIDPRVERYSTNTAEPGANAFEKAANFVRKATVLRKILKHIGAKTVLSFMCRGNNIAYIATLGTSIRLIVSERNDPVHSHVTKLDALIRPFTYSKSDVVVVQTRAIAKTIQEKFNPRLLKIIPNPVPKHVTDKMPQDTPAKPYMLAVGRLAPQKGFDLLIEAYAQSSAKDQYDLMIIGQGGELVKLQQIARNHGVEDKVVFRGHVKDATPYYNQCSFFVLSSLYEGFPNVLVEAMSAGCAVITFDFPSGANEIVTEGVDGLIVPLGDVAGLTHAIDRVSGDESLRKTLALHAVPSMERFSMQAVLDQWKNIAA